MKTPLGLSRSPATCRVYAHMFSRSCVARRHANTLSTEAAVDTAGHPAPQRRAGFTYACFPISQWPGAAQIAFPPSVPARALSPPHAPTGISLLYRVYFTHMITVVIIIVALCHLLLCFWIIYVYMHLCVVRVALQWFGSCACLRSGCVAWIIPIAGDDADIPERTFCEGTFQGISRVLHLQGRTNPCQSLQNCCTPCTQRIMDKLFFHQIAAGDRGSNFSMVWLTSVLVLRALLPC